MTETPLMDKYTDDLTAAVALNPDTYRAIARDDEIRQVIYNLNRRSKNNPILIGEAGVGKTAIVEGLARLIVLKKAGRQLNDKRIRVLQIAALGQTDDEVHTIMGVDSSNGAMDLGDVLKPAMARGDIQLIGSTTLDEYDKFIERDPALQRRFQQVLVNEPTRATAIRILRGIKGTYEKYHHVRYSEKAVVGCVDLSIRYIADRYLPDKAIDLLDQAGAIAATHGKDKVGLKEIALVLQEMKGIPVTNVLRNDNVRLRNMRQKLGETVKGQPEAIKAVADAITIAKAGLQAPNKPLSSFLFLGTTGTGKTALSKALAKVMFDDEEAMVRFDMSEFSERSSLDHFQELLTDQIKRQPYCILLFDEIEKACTAVHDRLLQVLDDGELRDKRGRSTNFRNSIIIMTTNLGADLIADKESYEHAIDEASLVDETPRQRIRRRDAFRKQVQMELTNIFRPEFVNRIQHKIVFNMLTRDIIEQIARNDLKVINQRLAEHGFKLEFQQDLIDYLADVGTDVKNGARPLERVIERDVTAPLSMIILQLESTPDNHYHTIQTEVSDHRTQLERQPLQRHLINGRQIVFKQLLDTNSTKEGTKVG